MQDSSRPDTVDGSGDHSAAPDDTSLTAARHALRSALAEDGLTSTLRDTLRESVPSVPAGLARDSFAQLTSRIAYAEMASRTAVRPPAISRVRSTQWRRIAVLGLAVAVAVFGGLARFSPSWLSTRPAIAHAVTTYATNNGERATITLVDGTVVTLNVASRLDIPSDFGHGRRDVRLTGQAYFDVSHTAGTPFTIAANGTTTTVLGTAFGVRAYPASRVQVAVRSGRVQVNGATLGARDVAEVGGDRVTRVTRGGDVDVATAFTSNRLVLDNVPLRDAIQDLDRWYDVDIRLGDRALGDRLISTVFRNGSAADLTDILQLMFNVRVERSGRTLTLFPH